MTGPTIDHAPNCPRRTPPLLRLSWTGRPQLACRECGRYVDVPEDLEHDQGVNS